MRATDAKGAVVQLDYIIRIQEIKPWPPSQSLKTLRSVLIQWEYGPRKSGSTSQVVPLLGTGSSAGDGRIEFNESFRLPVVLTREKSNKTRKGEYFVKNCIEFNLYEPRRDQTVKGQLLGTAVLDFAEYGVIKQNLDITVSINCKRAYGNTVQPLLFLSLQRYRSQTNLTSNSVLREPSNEGKHGVSAPFMVNEECGDEAESGSLTTDDDISSHSSLAVASSTAGSNGSSSPQNKHDEAVTANCIVEVVENEEELDKHDSKTDEVQTAASDVPSGVCSSKSSSINVSSDMAWISRRITSQSKDPFTKEEEGDDSCAKKNEYDIERQSPRSNVGSAENMESDHGTKEDVGISSPFVRESTLEHIVPFTDASDLVGGIKASTIRDDIVGKQEAQPQGIILEQEEHKVGAVVSGDISKVQIKLETKSSNDESAAVPHENSNVDKSKNGKSVRSLDSSRSHASPRSNYVPSPDAVQGSMNSNPTDNKYCSDDKEIRIQHLELRMKDLEAELREMAAIEASIYSVVAEHRSSTNKVHAPARRLWRFYSHASKQYGKSSLASAARSVVAGLVLAARACGSDVPRLTFWLSNSVVLRVIVNMSMVENQFSDYPGPGIRKADALSEKKQPSAFKWETLPRKSVSNRTLHLSGDWANPSTFAAALEKVESWIFSGIIESLWSQTFTPHMQSGAAKGVCRSKDLESSKTCGRSIDSTEGQQANFSVELWKRAFRDTCERICPIRAEGHNCGCLPVLLKLIMEQLISRLDVAMFNAILREPSNETPTDPAADPINDARVLPIPTGKTSFGAGAQLKNALGSWSRLLTDLIDIDDGTNSPKNDSSSEMADDDERMGSTEISKSFHLLNALSDLMMLPKDMLLSQTIRREVCPSFAPPLITRILSSFVPDEFCADPIPRVVFEALNSEDPFHAEGESIMSIPCAAKPIVYQAPSSASVSIFAETGKHPELSRTASSLLRKSQTSDDELDELDDPLSADITGGSGVVSPSTKLPWSSNTGSRSTARHHLLREVWLNRP